MMTQLQKIVAKAKTLRKSYPNLKWTDLIKKASKLVTPAKKSVSGINRKVVAKKSAPVKPLIKKRIESKSDFAMAGIKKKKAIKKAVKKSPARSMHKDTKSHNVRISVMSGVNDNLKQLNHYVHRLNELQIRLLGFQNDLKEGIKDKNTNYVKFVRDAIKLTKFQISTTKKHISLIKKSIK